MQAFARLVVDFKHEEAVSGPYTGRTVVELSAISIISINRISMFKPANWRCMVVHFQSMCQMSSPPSHRGNAHTKEAKTREIVSYKEMKSN